MRSWLAATRAGHVSLAVVVLVWAGAFPVIKSLLDDGFGAVDIAILRYLVAAPAFVLWRVGGLPGLRRGDAVRIAAAGILVVVGYHLFLNIGTRSTTSGTAALIVALAPGMTVALAAYLGVERLGLGRVAGLALAFAGVAIVVLLGAGAEVSLASAKGPAIVVGAPLCFALYNVLLGPLFARHGVLALTAASSLVGTLALLPLVRGSTLSAVSGGSAGDVMLVLYLGVISTLFGYVAWNVGLRALGPSRAVAYTYGIPPVAVVLGAILLGETVTAWLALGGLLILGGVWLTQRAPAREPATGRTAPQTSS